tara:strand:+ start:224 stop:1681 length:1458 start_codon:yes stop_codon:yes gene_type:complete
MNIENKAPVTYEDWLNLNRVIIPCVKGVPRIPKYTQKDFKIEKEEWKRDYEKSEIALRLDVDIDLDVDNPIVKDFIPYYIKNCSAIFGRAGNLSSHYLWTNETKLPFKQFRLPDEFKEDYKDYPHGGMLCELRAEKERYTIVPGSLHSKSKTNVQWETYEGIKPYKGNLLSDVGKIALAAALVVIYPTEGGRDEYCTAIAGILCSHSDWSDDEINDFIYRICEAANDNEREKRKEKGTSSRKTDKRFGINKIHQITGYSHANIQKLFNWIGLFESISTQISNDMIEKIVEFGANRYYVHLNVPEQDKIIKRRITVHGEDLINQKIFYDKAIHQAKAWMPKLKPHEYQDMMAAKFSAREYSKDFVEEANEEFKFKRMFIDYIESRGLFTDREQLAFYHQPYFDNKNNTIEFNLDSFERELAKQKINMDRVDLVMKCINVLKAKKKHGKYKNKSCVSWVIQGDKAEENTIIWEGEAIEIDDGTNIEE